MMKKEHGQLDLAVLLLALLALIPLITSGSCPIPGISQ